MIFSVYHYIITQTEKEEQNIYDHLGNDLVLKTIKRFTLLRYERNYFHIIYNIQKSIPYYIKYTEMNLILYKIYRNESHII